jgi:hypothetical protein
LTGRLARRMVRDLTGGIDARPPSWSPPAARSRAEPLANPTRRRCEVPIMRRVLGAILLAALALALTAQLAMAAKPLHDKFTDEQTFTEELCGIPVTTHVEFSVNFLGFEGRFIDASHVRVTWTNVDGDRLELFAAGAAFGTEELVGDILTVTLRQAGVQERLASAGGPTPAFDRGQIVLQFVIDLNDLENPEDDVFVSFEVLSQAGPHPEADSDFALFCEVVTDVLG